MAARARSLSRFAFKRGQVRISASGQRTSAPRREPSAWARPAEGIPFGRGALSNFLRNRFFIGEVKYRGEILPGEQAAILDKALFEAVQQKLSEHQSHKTLTRLKYDHLLKALLFDDAGHRMIATHATKAGVRYRYYASRPSLHGEAGTAKLGSVSRVPALEIEQAIISALQKYVTAQTSPAFDRHDPIEFDHDVLATLVSRIEVQRTQLAISLKPTDRSTEPVTLSIPWQKPPTKRFWKIPMPHGAVREDMGPIVPSDRWPSQPVKFGDA